MSVRSKPHKALSENKEAVDGLPMTLVITMVVLAITIPLVFGSLRAYDMSRTETGLRAEIESFISMVQLVYSSGPGNSASIELDASNGGLCAIDYIVFGDAPGGPMASVVRYAIQGRQEVMILAENPNVPMCTMEDSAFELSSGKHTIIAECQTGDQDLNGDGLGFDCIVRLSLYQ